MTYRRIEGAQVPGVELRACHCVLVRTTSPEGAQRKFVLANIDDLQTLSSATRPTVDLISIPSSRATAKPTVHLIASVLVRRPSVQANPTHLVLTTSGDMVAIPGLDPDEDVYAKDYEVLVASGLIRDP